MNRNKNIEKRSNNVSIYKSDNKRPNNQNRKKTRVNKRKVRRQKSYKSYIIILIISLVILLISVLSGRNKFDSSSSFYLNNEIVRTKKAIKYSLAQNSSAKIAIFSLDDIKNIFDKNIKYNKDNEEIISIGDTHIAHIIINDFAININGTDSVINAPAFVEKDTVYLPINDLSSIYGIEVFINDENKLFIDAIHKEKKVVKTSESVKIKKGKSFLSKTIGKLDEFEDAVLVKESKRKLKIRSNEGIYGYIPAKKAKNIVEVRSDYIEPEIPKYNFIKNYSSPSDNFDKVQKKGEYNATVIDIFNIEYNPIKIKSKYDMDESGYEIFRENLNKNNIDVFAKVNLSSSKAKSNLESFDQREEVIKSILKHSSTHKIQGIELILDKKLDKEVYTDFIREIKPRLKSRGLKLALPNESILNDEIKEIIDYGI